MAGAGAISTTVVVIVGVIISIAAIFAPILVGVALFLILVRVGCQSWGVKDAKLGPFCLAVAFGLQQWASFQPHG
jgi:hypothetical protein